MANITRQARPDSGLGFRVEVRVKLFPSRCGCGHAGGWRVQGPGFGIWSSDCGVRGDIFVEGWNGCKIRDTRQPRAVAASDSRFRV